MSEPVVRRGEVWWVDLGEPIGHEAAAVRPGLVLSDDRFNVHGLVSLCPITRTRSSYPTRVELEAGGSGLAEVSYVQAEQVRTVSRKRLTTRAGQVDPVVLAQVEQVIRRVLRL
ncbi:type II toxin-antitoxin system PemK/MazF family toxin [Aquipuribacter sp. MA13-13]|uniref:type II toxin-antitoxin system PemK/MazF family toxin n=1 Tax=Aquipuribacter sp. MA13-13 TaxID=3440840 RepID=UPI003EEC0CC7